MKPHEHVILEIARERERQMQHEGWTPAGWRRYDADTAGSQQIDSVIAGLSVKF